MAKYQVKKAWYGVKVGQVVELEKLHPSLKSHVIELTEQDDEGNQVELTTKERKAKIAERLTELGIEFKATFGIDKLIELLPDGELEKLFPTE